MDGAIEAGQFHETVAQLRASLASLQRAVERMEGRGRLLGGSEVLRRGALTLDPCKHEVRVDEEPIHVSKRDFELLHLLLSEPGRVWSKATLLQLIWNTQYAGYLPVLVKRICLLRRRLGPAGAGLQAVYGVGYTYRETRA